MAAIHGNLLIGGMALKDLDGLLTDEDGTSDRWTGTLTITRAKEPLLEVGRPYRLELDDGRAGQVVVRQMRDLDEDYLRIDIEGRSPLQPHVRQAPMRNR
jgi:hypothetical protein